VLDEHPVTPAVVGMWGVELMAGSRENVGLGKVCDTPGRIVGAATCGDHDQLCG